MSTTTMPSTAELSEPVHTKGVSHVVPFLLAIALLAASTVLSVLISGPMH